MHASFWQTLTGDLDRSGRSTTGVRRSTSAPPCGVRSRSVTPTSRDEQRASSASSSAPLPSPA
eukprot:4541017-Prymnesium_polylepis.1